MKFNTGGMNFGMDGMIFRVFEFGKVMELFGSVNHEEVLGF